MATFFTLQKVGGGGKIVPIMFFINNLDLHFIFL
jgi:hypothetical protein